MSSSSISPKQRQGGTTLQSIYTGSTLDFIEYVHTHTHIYIYKYLHQPPVYIHHREGPTLDLKESVSKVYSDDLNISISLILGE